MITLLEDIKDNWFTPRKKKYLTYIFKPYVDKMPITIDGAYNHTSWILFALADYNHFSPSFTSTILKDSENECETFICHHLLFDVSSMSVVYCSSFIYLYPFKVLEGQYISLLSQDNGTIGICKNNISTIYPLPLTISERRHIESSLSNLSSSHSNFRYFIPSALINLIICYLSYLPPETVYDHKVRMKINRRLRKSEQDAVDRCNYV